MGEKKRKKKGGKKAIRPRGKYLVTLKRGRRERARKRKKENGGLGTKEKVKKNIRLK